MGPRLGISKLLESREEVEMIRTAFLIFASIVFAACIPLTSGVDGTATQEALNNAATQTAAALTTPTVTTPTTTSPTASIVTPTGTGETPVPAATVSATVTQPP